MLSRVRKFVEDKFGIRISRIHSPYQLELYERLYPKERLLEKPFYNVGACAFWHPYWTNLDYVSEYYSNEQKDVINYDLMALTPLPIKSDSAEIIYTSHTIEHVKDEAIAFFFAEARRALKSGGIFRVTTGPDAETDFRALMRGDADWFYWDEYYNDPKDYQKNWSAPPASAPLEERWLNHVAGPLAPLDRSPSPVKYRAEEIRRIIAEKGLEDALQYFTDQVPYDPERTGNHVSWWTHEKVMQYMRNAGFSTVYRSGYGQSASPLMRHSAQFDCLHPQMSIYVEAIRD